MRVWLFAIVFSLGLALANPATYRVTGWVRYRAHGPMGDFEGKNPAVTGTLTWDAKAHRLSGEVCLDLRRWDSGEPLRDRHTRDMFQVDRYPNACYRVRGLGGDLAAGSVRLLGTLRLQGVERPLELSGRLRFAGARAVFDGAFETKITDWKMRRPSLLGFKVRDRVKVWVHGEGVAR